MFCGDGAYRIVSHRQHGRTLREMQRFHALYLRPYTFVAIAGYAPAVSSLHSPHIFRQRVNNLISDRPSHSLDLTNNKLLTYLNINFTQRLPWQLWTTPPRLVSGIASALRQKTSKRGCLLAEPPPPMDIGTNGPTSAQGLPSTPYSLLENTLSPSSTHSLGNTGQGTLRPTAVRYDPKWLRMPYGRLDRLSRFWGPKNHG